jgi:N-acetylglucosamine-6-phosphate deacetylase
MKNQEYTVVHGGTVLTPVHEIKNGVLILKGSRIIDVGERGSIEEPAAAVTIDAEGKIIAPGMIDIHVHGSKGADVMDASPEAYKTMSDFFVTRGVTGFLATALTMPDSNFFAVLECVHRIQEGGNLPGAEILGVHMEGPFLNPEQKGCHPVDLLVPPAPQHYGPFLDHTDVLKEMTLAPEIEGAPQLVRDLRQAGVLATAGHSNGIAREMMPAIDEGITHAVHFFCNMGNFRRDNLKRVAGATETLLYDDRITTELIADGWHLGDILMKLTVKVKGVDRVCFVTDAMTAAGMPPGRYFIGHVEAIVKDGIAKLPDNTAYASSVTTMDVCLRNGVRRMDLSLKDSLRMATLTPAEIIGVDDRKGSLEKGKDADVMILDENMEVQKTIARGKVAYQA